MAEPYKILLVDDEKRILDGIGKAIQWKELGYELIGTAENGIDALELAEMLRPDVVITDIKMPFMDGLTLCRELHHAMPDTRLIILTGFDEFEYAQKAIEINVSEYILKPVNPEEISAVLRRTKLLLDDMLAEKYSMEQLREAYESSLPQLKTHLLYRMLSGGMPEEQIREQAGRYGMDLDGRCWCAAVIQYDEPPPGTRAAGEEDTGLRSFMALNLVGENLPAGYECLLYNGNIAIIAAFEEPGRLPSFIQRCDQLCMAAERRLELSVCAGIGTVVDRLSDLQASLQEAYKALRYRVLAGTGRAVYINDFEPAGDGLAPLPEYEFRDLLTAITLGRPDAIEAEVWRFIAYLKNGRLSFQDYQLVLIELYAELLKVARGYGLDGQDERVGLGRYLGDGLPGFAFDSLGKLQSHLMEICLDMGGRLRKERGNKTQRMISEAREYIQAHYSEESFSLHTVVAHFHFSPSYFSNQFKQVTGEPFTKYLTRVRMEAAVKLLATEELGAGEIGKLVGYPELTYFSYVFKKHFGVSPTKYRNILYAEKN